MFVDGNDAATNARLASIPVDSGTHDLTVDASNGDIYVLSTSATLYVHSAATGGP